MKTLAATILLLALTGCATRDWVKPADVPAQLAQREKAVATALQTATGPQRERLHIIDGALVAARRALESGNTERARQELQVAIDLMDGVK